jgi:hypothetical protein
MRLEVLNSTKASVHHRRGNVMKDLLKAAGATYFFLKLLPFLIVAGIVFRACGFT